MFPTTSRVLMRMLGQLRATHPTATVHRISTGRSMLCVSNGTAFSHMHYSTSTADSKSRTATEDTTSNDNGLKSALASILAKGQSVAQSSISQNSSDAVEKASISSEEEDRKSREKSWRNMKMTLTVLGISFTCFGCYLIIELGRPRTDEHGNLVKDKFSSMPLVKQYLYRTVNEMYYYGQLFREPSREKLLPDPVTYPYYQPKYTVVLEFRDVLVHPDWTYQTGWRFKKRPGIDHFLESISGAFEIVVYTAEQGMTVFPIVDAIDPKNHINYKLVRDATLFIDGQHVKDLAKINRDLSKTIVIDWDPNSSKYHPENVLAIPKWSGNDDDVSMYLLTSFLLTIAQNDVDDVRDVITHYNQFPDPLAVFRDRQRQFMASEDQVASQEKEQQLPQIKGTRWTPSIFKKH